ncbi:hypothetical protein VTO42DRAFT_318 [Malbranchea cinnamomea]
MVSLRRGRNLREITFNGPNCLQIGRPPAFDYFGDCSFYLLDSTGHAVGHLCGLARTTSHPDTFVLPRSGVLLEEQGAAWAISTFISTCKARRLDWDWVNKAQKHGRQSSNTPAKSRISGTLHFGCQIATAVDFQSGVKLKDMWKDGPRTFLGLFVKGFPNMAMIMGPHQMFGSIEFAVGWVADFLAYCRDHNITWAEATQENVGAWTEHVHNCAVGLLSNEVDSWMTGVNKNLAHKQMRIIARY